MIRHLTILTINFLLIGCCSAPNKIPIKQGSIQPTWFAKLPMGSSEYIYNGGLINPPLYDNCLIYHTTIRSNNTLEDNRLCGVNINTGKVDWIFPTDTNQEFDYCFDGEGYIYQNFLITKSTSQLFTPKKNEDVICIDLNSKNEIRRTTYENSTSSNTSVVGFKGNAYYLEYKDNELSLYSENIITGITHKIIAVQPEISFLNINMGMKIIINESEIDNPKLLFFVFENFDRENYRNTIYNVDLNTNKVTQKIVIPSRNHYIVGDAILLNNKLFVSIGGHVICYNTTDWSVIWEYYNSESISPEMNISNGIIFKHGTNDYVGINAQTGEQIYFNKNLGSYLSIAEGWYVYLIGRDARVYIIDIRTGAVLDYIVCPEESVSGDGFNGGVYPTVVDNKLYVMSYSTAYCYPTYPWK